MTKTKKTILGAILCFAMVLCVTFTIAPNTAFAATGDGTSGGSETGEWFGYCGDDGQYDSAFGAGGGIDFMFAIKIPTAILPQGDILSKVSLYVSEVGTYHVRIYSTDATTTDPGNANPDYEQEVTMSSLGWEEVVLTTPYRVDKTKNLWIGLDSNLPFPASHSNEILESTDCCMVYFQGTWCSITEVGGSSIQPWLIRGYFESSVVHHEAVAPSCTQDGTVEYWTSIYESGVYYANADGTETLDSIVDPKLGHDMTYHEAVAPSCTQDGNVEYWTCSHEDGVYYANADGTAKLDSVVDHKLGHDFGGEVSYSWNNNKCTASRKCQHAGCNEIESETVTGVYVKDTDATCESNEKGHYEATFTNSNFAKQVTEANSVEKPDTKLPKEGLSAGAIVGIVVGSLLLLVIIVYLLGYFFLYRKGKLDDKKIRVIYSFLPKEKQ